MADLFPVCPHCGTVSGEQTDVCPSCGEDMDEREDTHIGQVINGAYAVHELIGEGAIGRVYRATQLSLKKTVAIKVLHAGFSRDEKVKKRFKREALAASRISHPNAVTVLEFGESQYDRMFLAMEFVEGRSLADELKSREPLSPVRIVDLLIQVCAALGEAHAGGVIHRDIKPENIMLVQHRAGGTQVKVLDFGIAQFQSSEDGPQDTRLTRVGHACGTPGYMSPEQARSEKLDARADLYSVGVVMYEALTGFPPFEAEAMVDLVAKHLYSNVPSFERTRPGLEVPEPLERICLKALAKKPEARFDSALAMQEALEQVRDQLEASPAAASDDLDLDDPTVVADPIAMQAAAAQTKPTDIEAEAPVKPASAKEPEVELPRLEYGTGDDLSLDEQRQWKVVSEPPEPAPAKEPEVELPRLDFDSSDELTIDRKPRWKPKLPEPSADKPEPKLRPPWEKDKVKQTEASEAPAMMLPAAKPTPAARAESRGFSLWPVIVVFLMLLGVSLFFTLRGGEDAEGAPEAAEGKTDPTLADVKAETARGERLLRGAGGDLRQEVERQATSKTKDENK